MKERRTIRCALWRLLPILITALICVGRTTAQYAPVVDANDQHWLASFAQQAGPQRQPGPEAGHPDSCQHDSMLYPLPADACGSGCGSGICGPACQCNECCPMPCCHPPKRKCLYLFGEYLYLRPRNVEVAYAVPIDGPVAPVLGNGIQIGPTALVDPDHTGAYRFGFGFFGCQCGVIGAQWTRFESSSDDSATIQPPNILRSMVTHPLGVDAASDGLDAIAQLDIDFDLIDLTVRTPWARCRRWHTDVIWGLRYGDLRQNFTSVIDVNGPTTVTTDVDFNGIGPQIGLASIHQIGCKGLHVYGRGDASFMVGTFDANYLQTNPFAGGVQVNSSWESGRVVPELEMELGFGWASCKGRFHLRCGYMVNAWFNAVRTNEFINAVQLNNPDDLGSGITFDGLVVHTEFRF